MSSLPRGDIEPSMFPSLLSHGLSSGNKLSAAVCFHSVISFFHFHLRAHTFVPTRTFLLLFLFLLILIHLHHHSILSHIKSNACLFCIHVLRHRKLAVLECDCGRSGVDLGRLTYLHSSLTAFLKAVSSSPGGGTASFQVRSALQPVTGCVIIIPFLSSNSDWHVQKEHYLKIIPH